jgi:hypothetical protein
MKKYICQSCGKVWYSAADREICSECQGKLKEENMPNKKAPDVMGDNHSAVENNQLQDSTETPKNQIPDEILVELATMHKRFRELYGQYRLCGIGDPAGVHLASEAFLDTFADYNTSDFNHPDYTEKLTTTAYGVTFFCIR